MSALVGDAEELRAANANLETQLSAARSAVEQRDAASVEALKEQEETTRALYNQLDTANQVGIMTTLAVEHGPNVVADDHKKYAAKKGFLLTAHASQVFSSSDNMVCRHSRWCPQIDRREAAGIEQ